MFKRFKFIFVLSLPLLCKYAFLLLFVDWNLFELEDILEDLLFFIVIVLLPFIKQLNKPFFSNFVCFIYVLYIILETTSYIAVSSNFSSSFMYLLLESNTDELKEFSTSYISIPIIIFIILNSFLFFIIRKVKFKATNKSYSIIGLISIIFILIILKFSGLIESNAYHNIIRGTYGYIDLQTSLKINSDITKEDLVITSDNEILVFVLGESTARGHLQIYDYRRKTTPLLESIKDSLFVFNNVISTDVFTLKSVPKILTSLDIVSKKEKVFNIVDVFNTAGYKTYWLSNQRPISYHDNVVSKIASGSDMFKFYNHIIDKNTVVIDEIMLPDYNEILKKPGKKVVFLRLIGTHFDYNKRYPESFNKFGDNLNEKSKSKTIINQYDNAILYNDYIIYSLIDNLKKMNSKSALLYLSDHGENVYDNGTDFFGRSEEILTKSMFEIPFILWTSENFEFPKDFEYNSKRKFMADHTYESIGHIFGVLHKSMDSKKSIFSERFKERKRLVLNGLDYDEFFVEKNE